MPDFRLREIDRDPLFRMWGINKQLFKTRQDVSSSSDPIRLQNKIISVTGSVENKVFSNLRQSSLLLAPPFWLSLIGGIITAVTHQSELSSELFKFAGLDFFLILAQGLNLSTKLTQTTSLKKEFAQTVFSQHARRKDDFS